MINILIGICAKYIAEVLDNIKLKRYIINIIKVVDIILIVVAILFFIIDKLNMKFVFI